MTILERHPDEKDEIEYWVSREREAYILSDLHRILLRAQDIDRKKVDDLIQEVLNH